MADSILENLLGESAAFLFHACLKRGIELWFVSSTQQTSAPTLFIERAAQGIKSCCWFCSSTLHTIITRWFHRCGDGQVSLPGLASNGKSTTDSAHSYNKQADLPSLLNERLSWSRAVAGSSTALSLSNNTWFHPWGDGQVSLSCLPPTGNIPLIGLNHTTIKLTNLVYGTRRSAGQEVLLFQLQQFAR